MRDFYHTFILLPRKFIDANGVSSEVLWKILLTTNTNPFLELKWLHNRKRDDNQENQCWYFIDQTTLFGCEEKILFGEFLEHMTRIKVVTKQE